MLKTIVIIVLVVLVILALGVMASAIMVSDNNCEDEIDSIVENKDEESAEDSYYGLSDNEIYKDNGSPFHG